MSQNTLTIAASTGALVPAPGQGLRPGDMTDAVIEEGLQSLVIAGFMAVELSDIWLDSRAMPPSQAKKLARMVADAGLSIIGLSTLGLEDANHALDIAQELGAQTFCIGLHKPPSAGRENVSFWANPPATAPAGDADFEALAASLQPLCKRAGNAGIRVVMEMNENAIIDRSAHVLRLLDMVDADNLGVNPDLGNLTRVTEPMIETWYETLNALAPHTEYWHVKNNLRMEHPDGIIVTHPSAMEDGVIDYRIALQTLLACGFSGPIVVESYWGDRIGGLERSRIYLEKLTNQISQIRRASGGQ